MTRSTHLCLAHDFADAREIHRKYFRLMDANFIETNPGPVKAALGLMGLLDPVFRLPLVAPRPENLAKIRSALEAVGLVQKVYAAR
jgi:4-hydroxy-tetrahydrodipicolinate synthase